MRIWTPILALTLFACSDGEAREDRRCDQMAARFHASEYVNPTTGRIDRDPTTNEIVDPDTGRIAVTKSEEQCIRRGLERTIDSYEKGG